jgi:hypothetical protein
MVVDRIDFVV